MIVNLNGRKQEPVGLEPHWIMFTELARDAALFNPLHDQVVSEVNALVATAVRADVSIDSSRLGSRVLESIGSWWHGEFPRRHNDFPNGAARGLTGMVLWNHLATRPDEWWCFTEEEDRHGLGHNHMLYSRLPLGHRLIPRS
jgi:hypothetical protein